MKKTAFVFSGQGSQYVGMGKELVENFTLSEQIFETGSEIVGFDLHKAVSGDEENLKKTSVAQPCIFAVSLAAYFAARKTGIIPDAVAGHSLGEYAAMVASGMLGIEDGFKIVKLRSLAMQRASEMHPGGMAAVMGAKIPLLESICEKIREEGDYVIPVNYNSPAQTVIAGSIAGLSKATKALETAARRIVPLPVGAAFHSALMADAADEFKKQISDFSFNKPDKPFYSNVTGRPLTDFSDMPNYLARHMCSPVRFTDELVAMQSGGIEIFAEVGPGKVLTAFIKKTVDGAVTGNIEDCKSLEGVNRLWQTP